MVSVACAPSMPIFAAGVSSHWGKEGIATDFELGGPENPMNEEKASD